jgi:hypothetical protein
MYRRDDTGFGDDDEALSEEYVLTDIKDQLGPYWHRHPIREMVTGWPKKPDSHCMQA